MMTYEEMKLKTEDYIDQVFERGKYELSADESFARVERIKRDPLYSTTDCHALCHEIEKFFADNDVPEGIQMIFVQSGAGEAFAMAGYYDDLPL
jgi:hypothetical protein